MVGFPAFWPFSLQVYDCPGVAAACLALQERWDADVNLVLWCGWRAGMGGGVCGAADLHRAIAVSAPWQSEVVQPLRSVRRALKPRATRDAAAASFRDEVKRLELEAERLEQQVLERLGPWPRDPERPPHDRLQDARTSLTAYLRVLGAEPDAADQRAIAVIAAACIADISPRGGVPGSV